MIEEEAPGAATVRGSSRFALLGGVTRYGWIGAWSAILGLSFWLSQLAPMWLVLAAVGSCVWTLSRLGPRFSLGLVSAALLWVATLLAVGVQARLSEIADDWEALRPRVEEPLADALGDALEALVEQGEAAARGAAEAANTEPMEPGAEASGSPALFDQLARLQRTTGVSAIALFDATGTAIAWGGEHQGGVPAAARLGTVNYLYQEGPLYSYLYFIRRLPQGYTAAAAFLLEASIQGRAGTASFAERFESRFGVTPRFWTPDRARPESIWDWATDEEGPILSVSFSSLTQQDWWLRAADMGRKSVAVLAFAALAALSALWYRSRSGASGIPIVVATAAATIAPVDRLIGVEHLFSPLQFVLPGPLDISLGTLLILLTGLGLWLLTRALGPPGVRLSPRSAAALLVVLFPLAALLINRSASGGLLADRPAGGFFLQLSTTLLLAVPLFLILRNTRRTERLPARFGPSRLVGLVAPVLLGIGVLLTWSPAGDAPFVLAALWAGPPLLVAATSYPDRSWGSWRTWLTAIWFGATAALAFLWPMHMRAELARAEREIEVLGVQADPFLDFLLRQFAERATQRSDEGESGVNLLYHSWIESNLAREGYEARLSLWRNREATAELNLSELGTLPSSVVVDVLAPREAPTVVHYGGLHGLHYLLVAPLDDGSTVSVAVVPRRRLGGATSLSRFLHPGREEAVGQRSEMLYLVPNDSRVASADGEPLEVSADTVHWVRTQDGWQSETIVRMPEGEAHAHFVLTTASLPMLLTRAILTITAITATLMILWIASRTIRGEFFLARVFRGRWLRSFRGRLSITLFAFFLIPTVAFGAVSYGAVAREVIRSATSLAEQALNQAAENPALVRFGVPGNRSSPDLLLYTHGTLTAATAPEVLELGLFHTWLPPRVHLQFVNGEEAQRVEERRIADGDYLIAYRRIETDRTLAAPTPLASNEITVRQREFRDVALLVILLGLGFSVVLSLIVGRALVRPLDELSHAATTVGAGDLGTRLPPTRGDEFGNVYESFNRMVGRLDRTRAALVQETRRTETIVAEAATGVLALDAEGRVELINPRAAEILDGTVDTGDLALAAGGRSSALSLAIAGLMNSPAQDAVTEVEFEGRTVRMRLRRLSGDGAGGGGGAVIALEDVTAEMRTARVIAWGEMARQVAHEIKNPLTPIKLSVQHLRRAFEDQRPDFDRILQRNVDSILREIDRLSEISRAFARFGTPTAVASPLERVDAGQAVREVSTLYRGADGGVEIELALSPDSPLVIARAGEIKEVLLNLLENAREAVDPEGGHVVISMERDEDPAWWRLEVEDDGVGIQPDQLSSIFEPHFSTRSSGTGLGLAIVRRIVESWGGEITVVSDPGVRTRFTIRLRAAAAGAGNETSS